MKCIILDFEKGRVDIIQIDKTQIDEIETILTENYGYNLNSIEYMTKEELNINIL